MLNNNFNQGDMKKGYILVAVLGMLSASIEANAQHGFGTPTPVPSSVVEMAATDKGALLPRVALTSTTVATPVTAPANALTVFNTATAGDVTPGYYYWSAADSKWVRLIDKAGWELNGNAGTVDGINFLGTTDEVALNFRVNNIPSGRLDEDRGNVFFGVRAGMNSNYSGHANTAIGGQAMMENTTGQLNTSVGYNALNNNTTGSLNTATGVNALASNTIGIYNTAFGHASAAFNSTGSWNTGFGSQSLPRNTTGEYNLALGASALYGNLTGNQNIGLGNFALPDKETGNHNIALGYLSGKTLASGDNNIFIGHDTAPNISTTASNQLNIGNWVYGDNGKIGLGTALIPTNQLHIKGATNPVRFEGLQSGATTDNIVVADATGVLKTMASSNFMNNIYNVDGTLTANRTVSMAGFGLNFTSGTGNNVTVGTSGTQGILSATGSQRGALQTNGGGSIISIYSDASNAAQINSSGNSTELSLATLTNSPIYFRTNGSIRMTALGNGNVGIGTINPTNILHVTAASNPVRLEGLQAGATTDNIVVADATGVLKTRSPMVTNVLAGGNGADAVVSTTTIQVSSGTQTAVMATRTFTLTKRSVVTFSYNLSVASISAADGSNLADGRPKHIGTQLRWSAVPVGSPFTVGNTIQANSFPFTASLAGGAFGFYSNGSSRTIILDPGNYGVNLVALVFAQDATGVRATFGGNTSVPDQLDIVATPIE